MEFIEPLGDDRHYDVCVFCGGPPETADHVPCRVFLDEPYPPNLPVVAACRECNGGTSLDEEYVACLIECLMAGSADPKQLCRAKVAGILEKKPLLAKKLSEAWRRAGGPGGSFVVENDRVRRVLMKLARGHAAHELDQIRPSAAVELAWTTFDMMESDARDRFEDPPPFATVPELGSRSTLRPRIVELVLAPVSDPQAVVKKSFVLDHGWLEAQPGRYRYLAGLLESGHPVVRIVLSEFVACEAIWR